MSTGSLASFGLIESLFACYFDLFNSPLKNNSKIFVDRSFSLKFKRMIANKYRKIFYNNEKFLC